jgi:hypothetical protein
VLSCACNHPCGQEDVVEAQLFKKIYCVATIVGVNAESEEPRLPYPYVYGARVCSHLICVIVSGTSHGVRVVGKLW